MSEVTYATPEFLTALSSLLNQHNIDTEIDTPDFVLAEYLSGALSLYDVTDAKVRLHFWGDEPDVTEVRATLVGDHWFAEVSDE
jgi:hypothetical protein